MLAPYCRCQAWLLCSIPIVSESPQEFPRTRSPDKSVQRRTNGKHRQATESASLRIVGSSRGIEIAPHARLFEFSTTRLGVSMSLLQEPFRCTCKSTEAAAACDSAKPPGTRRGVEFVLGPNRHGFRTLHSFKTTRSSCMSHCHSPAPARACETRRPNDAPGCHASAGGEDWMRSKSGKLDMHFLDVGPNQ